MAFKFHRGKCRDDLSILSSETAGKFFLDELGKAGVLGQSDLVRVRNQIKIALPGVGIFAKQLHQTSGLEVVTDQKCRKPRNTEAADYGLINSAAKADESGRRDDIQLLVVHDELPMRVRADYQAIVRLQLTRMFRRSVFFKIGRRRADGPWISRQFY